MNGLPYSFFFSYKVRIKEKRTNTSRLSFSPLCLVPLK
uniref:Uncharacterized protein n=1 Tax=Utricularia reniformis TaxID=192314 RepID=A0A1Y0B1W9_9LAMI|nr:hypothetical protein AEK19_MT1229 [Utricularia reniformis]ART31442.1 hypothetical protein AEK19_MT1229 [Utricularia reniformis]